jgi:hypothetical protein
MADVAVPIVFPDYTIMVETPALTIDVPDAIPFVPDEIEVPKTKNRVPYLGHAGILFFDAKGRTRYYEYGRYDVAEVGLVRKHTLPDLRLLPGGKPAIGSLVTVLHRVSTLAGHGGRISAAYIELPAGAFELMLRYTQRRMDANTNPHRPRYALMSNSCLHFMKAVAEAGGAKMPDVLDPRPAGYIAKVRIDHPDLDYKPGGKLAIEGFAPW